LANRPDLIIKTKKEKICTVIDASVPSDRNVIHKETEKKLKYRNLCIEIQRMWKMKCFVIPLVIVAVETVTRGLRKYPEEIPGKHCKNCHPGNIAHTKESATVRSLKPEW
jgi:hypothetical protein